VSVILRQEARSDVLQAFEWYEERRTGLGVAFRDALDATVARILVYPTAFMPGERGLRRALVSRFPHAVYFRVYPEALVVVAVLHATHQQGVESPRG
jgi:plasmid stabilization system protein ParE